MENNNRLEELIKTMDNIQNSTTMAVTSGDEALKSVLEDRRKSENSQIPPKKSEPFWMPSEEVLEKVKEMQDGFDKLFHDDYLDGIYESFERIFNSATSKKTSDKEDITVEPMLLHEMFHGVDLSDYAQCAKQEETFSDDEVEYDEQLKHFIDFVTLNKEFGDSTLIRVKREGNIISYSRLQAGIELDNHKIIMTKSDNLKEIYGLLKTTFGPDFVFGSKHSMFDGWALVPSIGDKLMLEISSDEPDDRVWIYDEIHNRAPVIIDSPKKF